jgi:hypothetical protein
MKVKAAIDVAEWLRCQRNIDSIAPVFVQIGNRVFPAARYIEGRQCVEESRLYVVGHLPPLHDKRRICYRTDDSGRDWHVIAWFRVRHPCCEWSEVHPFGSHFLLARWTPVECWAADQCQPRPYHRISMTITECGPIDATEEKIP